MATEVKIRYDTDLREGDIHFIDGDFEQELGLESAILISIFTDKRASTDDDLDDAEDRRGWWGDQVSGIEEDEIGSKVWLLERAKTTTKTLNELKDYIQEALEWLVEDGIAAKIEVETERMPYPDDEILAFKVKVFKQDGNIITYKFNDLWEGQFNGI